MVAELEAAATDTPPQPLPRQMGFDMDVFFFPDFFNNCINNLATNLTTNL